MIPINIDEKFKQVTAFWDPKIIGELNGQLVKIARIKGEFVRHKHEEEDELFWVVEGQMKMVFDEKTEIVNAGECIIVPKGVYHQPIAENEVKIMLFEPSSTLNTGDVQNQFTKTELKKI